MWTRLNDSSNVLKLRDDFCYYILSQSLTWVEISRKFIFQTVLTDCSAVVFIYDLSFFWVVRVYGETTHSEAKWCRSWTAILPLLSFNLFRVVSFGTKFDVNCTWFHHSLREVFHREKSYKRLILSAKWDRELTFTVNSAQLLFEFVKLFLFEVLFEIAFIVFGYNQITIICAAWLVGLTFVLFEFNSVFLTFICSHILHKLFRIRFFTIYD